MRDILTDIARATAVAHDMLPDGAPVLVMVSGGGDSVALLRLLAAGELGEGLRLAVLHVDHDLRPDSAADAAFVEALAADLAVPCRVVRFDVGAYAEREGLNLEDAGRRVRYRFAEEELDAMCDRLGVPRSAGRIAVAHTFDDRMETFLMRLLTGGGTSALAAIRHRRGRIVRPLLDARREAVRGYLRDLGQEWREDATNLDTARLRALVRHELLPLAFAVNPSFDETLARTLRIIEDEDTLIGEMADGFVHAFVGVAPGRVEFERTMMSTLTHPMRRRVVRAGIAAGFPEATRLEFDHIEALALAVSGEDAFARDLPFGLRAHTEYGRLVVARRDDAPPSLAPSLLEMPGIAPLGEAGIIRAERFDPGDGIPDDQMVAVIDADKVSGVLTVDGPREGDRMRPLGMTGTKKLSDLLVDAKVPKRVRSARPVVRDGERIVWLAGVRLAEDYRVGSETVRAVRLVWEPGVLPEQGEDDGERTV